MSFNQFGACDWSDFLQSAEVILLQQENGGLTFPSPEDRNRYRYRIAQNLWKDDRRIESNRRRILQENYKPVDHSERAQEISVAQQSVANTLTWMKANQFKRQDSNRLTARKIGTTMAAQLIEWKLGGLTHGEMACMVFKVEFSTAAQTRKICNAMKIAMATFKSVLLEKTTC